MPRAKEGNGVNRYEAAIVAVFALVVLILGYVEYHNPPRKAPASQSDTADDYEALRQSGVKF